MCDKKNKVLFTDSECLVLSPDFKLPDENQVLLRVPRQNNMYSFNLENIVPTRGLACLIAKATVDESNKWHRRWVMYYKFKKLVKGNLVRGLPSKIFQNDHTCVACQKGKQHKASNSKCETQPAQEYFVLPLWSSYTSTVKSSEAKNRDEKPNGDTESNDNEEQKIGISRNFWRIHSIYPITQILGDPTSAVQTQSKIEPQKLSQALEDESWVDAMQEELLQFKIQKVWILVDLPFGKKAIRTKWVYRNNVMPRPKKGRSITNMV
ncbi:ribonuclease H-like domain-containing protein [Tanacetum coccineum]|uniref:Ribonuclease H-like domain-containing protein n=1 Tax=Tanacetum coccineum TaxID=301880 RepID=A0ABQ4WTF2_9ASTR